MRWVHEYALEFKIRLKKILNMSNDFYRVDETYLKVKGKWHYHYRAIDSNGNTLDRMLSEIRSEEAAEKFFKQVFSNDHCSEPRVIGVDKNSSYPKAFKIFQSEGLIHNKSELRSSKYPNNVIE